MAIYADLAKLGRVKLPNNNTNKTYALVDVDGRAIIAPDFDTSVSYEAGDYVIYNDDLYRFTAAHSGAWTGTDADVVTVGSELDRLSGLIAGGIHYRGKTTTALYEGAETNPISIGGSSYTAEQGDLVIVDLSAVAATYATGTAYDQYDYIVSGGIYYIVTSDITASENTSLNAIAEKINVVQQDPEFLFDGTAWNALGAISDGLGDLAFKDSASGTYTKPTGSGTVVIPTVGQSKKSLETTTITGVAGTTTVSKVTAGTAVDVAKVGTAVRYGTADVGTAVTYGTANKAASATTVGNANVGTAVTYGNANVASAQTTVGNADVGDAVTVAVAGTQVVYGTADVGTAVTYGTANPGTAVTGVAKVDTTARSFATTGVVISSIEDDCLIFGDASTDTIYGVDSTGVSIIPAVASTTTLTPAVAAPSTQKLTPVGNTVDITPATSSTTKIYGAVASTTTLTPAVASQTEIYGAVDSTSTLTPATAAPSSQTIIPAVANGTITPYTTENVTVATSNASATTVATGSLVDGSDVVTSVDVSTTTATVTVGTTTATVTVD